MAEYAAEYQKKLTVGDWMLTILLTIIPVVNIIMLFVWSFSDSTPEVKSNWAKAMLIWMAIYIVLSIIFVIAFGSTLAGMGALDS